MTLPAVSWTLDGQPVFLEDGWTATAIAGGGFDRFQGVITEAAWHGLGGTVTQGSIVKGWTNALEPLWEGRLATIPDFSEGTATLAAMGHYVKAVKKVDRLFIQSVDMDLWQPTDGEPFLNGAGNPVYGSYKKMENNVGARIRWRVPPESLGLNSRNGVGFWAEGINLKRIRFVMNYAATDETANLEIQLDRANGPTGANTNVNAWTVGSGNRGVTQDETLGVAQDTLLLFLHVATAFSPGDTLAYSVSRIAVNSDIDTGDAFHAYQVMDHIGTTLGFDTSSLVAIAYNVLPFDFEGNWAEAADYVAELEDQVWGVYDDAGNGPRLTYTAWGARDWQCYLSHGATESLAPLEVFNRALVWYEAPSGVPRRAAVDASPDPLAASGIVNTYQYTMEDRQTDETLATAVATKLAAKFSRQRYAGRVTVTNAWDEQGRDNPYGIRPGDTLTIADWAPGESITLRVAEVEYRHDRVDLGIETPINLVHVFDALERKRRRRKRRKR